MFNRSYVRRAQIVTHIGETGERKIAVVETRVQINDDQRALDVDVENIGERWVRPTPWVKLYKPSGPLVEHVDSGGKRIYPGTSVRFRFVLPPIARGPYKALVVFDNALEGENVWGTQIDLDL